VSLSFLRFDFLPLPRLLLFLFLLLLLLLLLFLLLLGGASNSYEIGGTQDEVGNVVGDRMTKARLSRATTTPGPHESMYCFIVIYYSYFGGIDQIPRYMDVIIISPIIYIHYY